MQPTPADARRQLVARLADKGWITQADVSAAFTAVPRHLFAPAGTSLESAYADDTVVTQRGPDGRTSSSISAPWLQAYMLEQAQLERGGRVLEIGSGGYNAALLAELVGPAGTVVSVDIDPRVIAHAQTALTAAGYQQVRAVLADGEHGHPYGGPWDAVLVTVEASDIPPAWSGQLAPGGRLVVPLRMRGHTRCLTLTREADRLQAVASLQCGFVPMQGHGRDPAWRIPLRGDDAVLLVDDPTTSAAPEALRSALAGPQVQVWSGVTLAMSASSRLESLQMWLASQPRPYGVLNVDRAAMAGVLDPQDRFTCPTLLSGTSFAYLTMRTVDESTWEFGAHGYGPDATALTGDLLNLIAVWDREHRDGPGPQIAVYPAGTRLPDTDAVRLVVPRRHTLTAITWPGSVR